MTASPAPGSPPHAPSLYERWGDRLTDWCAYVFLTLSAVLSLSWSRDSVSERLLTAGLVVLAVAWVLLMYSRAPRPRQAHRVRMIVYFIGLLAIASLLAIRENLFFIFLITGFFHATLLWPWPLLIGGVFATSVLVNTVIGGFPTNPEWWLLPGRGRPRKYMSMARPTGVRRAGTHSGFRQILVEAADEWRSAARESA